MSKKQIEKRYNEMNNKFKKLKLKKNLRGNKNDEEEYFAKYRLDTIKKNIDNFNNINKDFIQKEFIELNNHIMDNIENEYDKIF